MLNDVAGLSRELSEGVTRDRLKTLSAEIISAYRKKDEAVLRWYASKLGESASEKPLAGLFAMIIQRYHPDRHALIHREIASLCENDDLQSLVKLKEAYLFSDRERRKPPVITPRSHDFDETDLYSRDEFYGDAYEEEESTRERDEWEGEGSDEWEKDDDWQEEEDGEAEWGFIEAVNEFLFGNQDFCVEPVDLRNYRGSIDLSGTDIADLQGAEHCVLVTVLNVSGNSITSIAPLHELVQLEALYCAENDIDSIRPLEGLVNLRELDISFNHIEDISVLLELPSLVYVNCMGNPVADRTIIEKLAARGVLVVF